MKLKVLTYNLLFNGALPHARKLIERENPDIICVQEILTTEKNLLRLNIHNMQLAGWTNVFIKHHKIYGNAIYVNKKTCELVSTRSDDLPTSAYDLYVFFKQGFNIPRSFVETKIRVKETGCSLFIYNIHASHLSFVEFRINQIRQVLDELKQIQEPDYRCLIMGDFNLYNGKRELEGLMGEYGLSEATNNLGYTFEHGLLFWRVRMKLDYILYKNISHLSTQRVQETKSDHYPVFAEFEL